MFVLHGATDTAPENMRDWFGVEGKITTPSLAVYPDARSSRDFWAAQNGCKTATWSAVSGRPECQRNTSCPAGEPLVYCETSGVGHDVPGFAVDEIGTFFSGLVK